MRAHFTGSQRILEVISVQCSNSSTCSIHGLYGGRGIRGVLNSGGMYIQVLISSRRKLKP